MVQARNDDDDDDDDVGDDAGAAEELNDDVYLLCDRFKDRHISTELRHR